ncbi:unnamed protein product [Mesocestoides corti]|uniref:Uncharacterized protein n=1 Tax=Mesocestoides corti TaxID=53468 RepID=A0A0R3URL9_MESCO|nr:unnamed protein product [Mesocestoides corti]
MRVEGGESQASAEGSVDGISFGLGLMTEEIWEVDRLNLLKHCSGVASEVFPQGGIYFGVGSVIRLVLRPLSSVRVNKDVNIDLSGILRCHTYSQKPNNHEPIHRPPIYFSQTVRLVAAAGGSCKPQTSKCTDGQCAASEANRSYIAGNDFIIYCDQVPDVAVDYQTHSACFRALDSAPGKWKGVIFFRPDVSVVLLHRMRFMGINRPTTLSALELPPRDTSNGIGPLDDCTSGISTIFNRFTLYYLPGSTVAL